MFENIRIIENVLNNPQHRDLTMNQYIIQVANIIELNHISLKWLFFEMIAYIIYITITSLYTYTIWSMCNPFQTIQSINRMRMTVHYQIIPQEYRCYMYRRLLKMFVFDLIRAGTVGFIYFKIQQMCMW